LATIPQILIVDENLDSRVQLRRTVLRADFQVCGEVGFGADAVSQAVESKPDVVLLAIEEPVTRPIETAEALADVLPETPLIFYSSIDDSDSVRRGLVHGARDYLVKPIQAARLKEAIDNALLNEERRKMRLAGQLAGTKVRGTIVSVIGAKGGIGKSVVAVNLALAFRLVTNRRVVLVDADTHFGDVATMLDLRPVVTASELLANPSQIERTKIGEFLTAGPVGLSILATPSETTAWEDSGPAILRTVIETLALNHDFVVVDTSGALDAHVKAIVEASTVVLLVTTGEVSSIRDTKAGLDRLDKWGVSRDKVKLLLNGGGGRTSGLKPGELEQAIGGPLFWDLPRDKEVPNSVQLGSPLVLSSAKGKIARSVFALASTIAGAGKDFRLKGSQSPSLVEGKSVSSGSTSIFRKISLSRKQHQRG
jgi:pilus assembly protein CpaE